MPRALLFAISLALSLVTSAPAQTPLERVGGLGINLDEYRYWNPCWAFVDAMPMCSEWASQTPSSPLPWNNGQPVLTDADGWPLLAPGQAAATVIWKELNGKYPGGIYDVFWEGTGQVEPEGDAELFQQVGPNHARFLVTPGNFGIVVRIVASAAGNPVKNIRVILPGFAASYQSAPFHPQFLERIAPFGVLRSMQWQNTNFSPLVNWSERPTPATYSQASNKGMCYEHLVALANESRQAMWYCLPYLASDDYVRQAARFVAQNQHPDVPAFVEYSNEVWNGDFPAYQHAKAQGLAQNLASLEFDAAMRWYSQRSVQIFAIWREEFEAVSGAAWSNRLVRVLGAQYANPYVGEVVADWQQAYQHADALAIAPYFGFQYGLPENLGSTLSKSNSQILAECAAEIQGTLKSRVEAYQQLASARGLDLIAYEGGQHLVPIGVAQTSVVVVNKLIAVNREPGMYGLFQDLLAVWEAAGGRAFLPYSFTGQYTKWGSWGVLEHLDQPLANAHKYRALADYAAAQPALPGTYRFGTACGTLAISASGSPKVGASNFGVQLSGCVPGAFAQLLLTAQAQQYLGLPLPIDLSGFAGAGCLLQVGDGQFFTGSATGLGVASFALAVPANPALAGAQVFLQCSAFQPGFGVLQIALSEGLEVTIGA
jgi:hypothetical protein